MLAIVEILDRYLEGTGSRADVESLRFRLDVPDDIRREIAEMLSLSDRLADALHTRIPDGAVDRLRQHLATYVRENPAPSVVMQGTLGAPSSDADLPETDEDRWNAFVEGAPATTADLPVDPFSADGGAAVHRVASALEDLRRDLPIPEGAVDRLTSRLRTFVASESGALDPAVVSRLLSPDRPVAGHIANRLPDVKAASDGPGLPAPSEDPPPPTDSGQP